MSFVSALRARRQNRRPVEQAIAAVSTASRRDELIMAATQKAGMPPRL